MPNVAKWDKDAWIRDALRSRYLVAKLDGTILRCTRAMDAGTGREVYEPVAVRTHKATGRVYFNLTWRGITKSVLLNRVMAWAFLPNPDNLPEVNHVDGVKAHNYLYQPTPELRARYGEFQLEWTSGSENETHAHRNGLKTGRGTSNANAKLTVQQVLDIRASGEAPDVLAARHDVAVSTIKHILNRTTWSHI